jgi:Ca2+:H+ antiporter
VAAILPVSYLVGLLFTLKTHAHIFSNAAADEGEGGDDGHDAPPWSKLKAIIILAVSIVLFSLVAEELVKAIEPTLEALNIGQTFAGVTVLALVPSSAEVLHPVSRVSCRCVVVCVVSCRVVSCRVV